MVKSRGLVPQAIQHFRGINAFTSLARLTPDWAQDLLNVLVSGSGALSKMRLPVALSVAIPNVNVGPQGFWDFQQGNGTRQVLAQFDSSFYYFTNDLSVAALIETNVLNAGQWSFVESNNILFGTNGARAQKWTGAAWQKWGIAAPVPVATFAVVAGALSPATGYTWTYAYKNSVTGHCGNVNSPSANTGAQAGKSFNLTAAAPTDPQDDTIVWFRILDGGGDQFRLAEVNLNTGVVSFNAATVTVIPATGNLQINDNTPDANLDQATRGPLINNPPLQGKFVATGQNRVAIFNLTGAPQDFIYSGYEQILFGRPEESFPPNNRIRLSIGAEQIAGGGILQAGIVAFSNTGRIFMLRGQLEDITLDQPVNFSSYLEELPWGLGCLSHLTIQNTPYGLIWLAGDKTVHVFDGNSEPTDISAAIYPLLRAITPGTETQTESAYFNWLERDWYALMCAVNGSLTVNRIFFFALNREADGSLDSVEVFISDIPAFLGGASWIATITSSTLQRELCIGTLGRIQQLPVSSDAVNGLVQDFTIIPATSGNLNAYWRSGYFGGDSPTRSRMWRFQRILTDQPAQAFQITNRYVDDERATIAHPEIIGPYNLPSPRIGLNRRAKRMSVEIDFPQQDVSANVIELQVTSIPTAER